MRRGPALALPLVCVAALPACESTQDKAAALRKQGAKAFSEKGLSVKGKSKSVEIRGRTVLSDPNGTAAVVELENRTSKTLRGVPIAIDVTNGRKSLFKNDDPGLEPSLVSIPILRPRERVTWVNDQVFAESPKAVKVKVGTEKGTVKSAPEMKVSKPELIPDPVSGLAAEGKVTNPSKILQKKLVLYAVARKGGKVVAAGAGGIEKLRPGKSAGYQIFFIGKPKGAKITIATPPTTLEEGT